MRRVRRHRTPRPRHAGSRGHVDREAEERALAAYQDADERRADAERRLGTVREALAAATAEAGDAPTARLAEEAEELERRTARARASAPGCTPLRRSLRRAEHEREQRIAAQQQARRPGRLRVGNRERLESERTALRRS